MVIAAYQLYLNQWLQIRWRRWLTDRYVNTWLAEGTHYRMRLSGDPADNPDQRIADDITMFVEQSLSLGIGLLSATMTLASFAVVLWGISSQVPLSLSGYAFTIPGYLLWVALAFSLVATVGAHLIGRKLIGLNRDQQRFAADFRFALVRLRENSEQIAMLRGEAAEQRQLTAYAILARPFFTGQIPLGTLMQTAGAFGQVQTSLSFFVTSYARLAEWKAVVDRLSGFEAQTLLAKEAASNRGAKLGIGRPESPMCLADVHVATPDGAPLLNATYLAVEPGKTLLLKGSSGCGKSTLLRTICGFWPHSRGRVLMAPGTRVLALPQRPYIPLGSLRAVLAYPAEEHPVAETRLHGALAKVGLSDLVDSLDECAAWGDILSLGEQQRIGFARALLTGADLLLLDEATSALDESSEAAIFRMLRAELPTAAIVSIGHRSTLTALHHRTIDLDRRLSLAHSA